MSWSKTASGTAKQIVDAAANWPGELDAQDKQYGASEGIRAGHNRQANAALAAIVEFAKTEPANRTYQVSASGHSNDDGTGNVSVSIQEGVAAVEEKTEETAETVAGEGDGAKVE